MLDRTLFVCLLQFSETHADRFRCGALELPRQRDPAKEGSN